MLFLSRHLSLFFFLSSYNLYLFMYVSEKKDFFFFYHALGDWRVFPSDKKHSKAAQNLCCVSGFKIFVNTVFIFIRIK